MRLSYWKGVKKAIKRTQKEKTKKMYGKTYRNCIKAEEANEDLETDEVLDEKKSKRDGKVSRSKGYSLRDWFKGGGWVQTGGKYDGKPCAKQPGQKSKPYCRDPDDRAKLSKSEREKRAKKKRREDGDSNRRGPAKNVSQKRKKRKSKKS